MKEKPLLAGGFNPERMGNLPQIEVKIIA